MGDNSQILSLVLVRHRQGASATTRMSAMSGKCAAVIGRTQPSHSNAPRKCGRPEWYSQVARVTQLKLRSTVGSQPTAEMVSAIPVGRAHMRAPPNASLAASSSPSTLDNHVSGPSEPDASTVCLLGARRRGHHAW